MTNTIGFRGSIIALDRNPRSGVCSQCGRSIHKGEIKMTCLHHKQYHNDDPLRDTIELCNRCHRFVHRNPNRKEYITTKIPRGLAEYIGEFIKTHTEYLNKTDFINKACRRWLDIEKQEFAELRK